MPETTARKPIFIPGVFDALRAITDAANAGPLRIPLADIDEDPDQPRTVFDPEQLEQLAETVRLLGVMQPIGVRPAVRGRHVLVFGARRLRASKLAGVTDIPAVIVTGDQAGLAAQVIENQSRVQLSNSDLASVVSRFVAEGMTSRQIAVICGLPDYQLKMFRSVERLPSFLAAKLNDGDIRAIYELFLAWQRAPAEIERAMEGHGGTLSVSDARRIVASATGKMISSFNRTADAPAVAENDASRGPGQGSLPANGHGGSLDFPVIEEMTDESPAPEKDRRVSPRLASRPPGEADAPRAVSAAAAVSGVPVFIMALPDGREGVLVTHRRGCERGRVILDVQGAEIEVPFTELRPVAVN